jgi:hypothetical protein
MSYLIQPDLGFRFCGKKSLKLSTNVVSTMRAILYSPLPGALSGFAALGLGRTEEPSLFCPAPVHRPILLIAHTGDMRSHASLLIFILFPRRQIDRASMTD